MRGKGILFSVLRVDAGITPAYAGKSRMVEVGSNVMGDHPRICGEKHDFLWSDVESKGSPPHMRGKENQPRRGRV